MSRVMENLIPRHVVGENKGEFLLETTIKARVRRSALRGKNLQTMRVCTWSGRIRILDRNYVNPQRTCGDTTMPKNEAVCGFAWTQQIPTTNQINQNLLRRRKACGTILRRTCVREPSEYSPSCATRTLKPRTLIARPTTTRKLPGSKTDQTL